MTDAPQSGQQSPSSVSIINSVDGHSSTERNSVDLSVPPPDSVDLADRLRNTRVKFRSFDDERGPEADITERPEASFSHDLEKADTARSDLVDEHGNKMNAPTRINSIRERARELLTKLGRPEDPGDGLTPVIWEDDAQPLPEPADEKQHHHHHHGHHPTIEAQKIVRAISHHALRRRKPQRTSSSDSIPGAAAESDNEADWNPRGEGILSQLLKLHQAQHPGSDEGYRSGFSTPEGGASGTTTPKKVKWYHKHEQSQSTLSLVGAGLNLGTMGNPQGIHEAKQSVASKRHSRKSTENHIAGRIAAIITRQHYLIQLCRALMKFGAPSHRLEEYMQMTARVLDVSAQFLYLPNTMIMSFDDVATRTAEVKLVRVVQGVDLTRLDDTQDIYKLVIHDKISVDEAIEQLDTVMNRPPRYPTWLLVLCYGFASAAVGPFAFEARPIDMPIIFFLGCILGVMQLVFATRSSLYSNVFEVLASVLTSFLARAIGSIRNGVVNGEQQYVFCFSAMAQSSIAIILPGFLVLSSSLELQSHQIIAGSIRMVYAIIYSLFLGYGITVGTTLYGLMDAKANPNTTCSGALIGQNQYSQRFPFVAAYVIFLVIINQGKWKQLPMMMFIAVAGYVVNYFSNQKLNSNPELANSLGALTIGVLGNLYSRLWHGHAATAILPAIFVLVPSGLAAQGSLVSGVQSAAAIRSNLTGHYNATTSSTNSSTTAFNSSVYDIGLGMIQVAIGITVGLFMAAVIVYPQGKRRSGLFSF